MHNKNTGIYGNVRFVHSEFKKIELNNDTVKMCANTRNVQIESFVINESTLAQTERTVFAHIRAYQCENASTMGGVVNRSVCSFLSVAITFVK